MKLLVVLAAAAALVPSALAAPPSVSARAVFVENTRTGEVLYASHPRARVPIASITKLMTALLTVDAGHLGDVVVVPAGADRIGESTIGLRAGERISVRDLLTAALVQSANDAAWALAYHGGHGSVARFVRAMNRRARALGLRDTHFTRPDGLDAPGHFSSARDVTRLAQVAMRRPAIRRIVAERTASISGGRTVYTWDDLLGVFPGLYGVKTGHTSEAGWSQVAAVRRPGVTIYATLLGSPSRGQRNADLTRLLNWALQEYRFVALVPVNRPLGSVATQYGRGPVAVVTTRPLRRAVRAGSPLVERVVVPRAVDLPIRRGQRLGEVRVYQRGRLLGARPLVAARSVSRPGLGSRLGWYARRMLHRVSDWFS